MLVLIIKREQKKKKINNENTGGSKFVEVTAKVYPADNEYTTTMAEKFEGKKWKQK